MALQFWLFKSEPNKWSFANQLARGRAGQQWDGVRNYQARNNMRAMKIGERGFFYHSNDGLAVVGIVEVCGLAHHDSTSEDERWECVDVRALAALPVPVSLDAIKANSKLAEMVLVKNSRLSVQPVTAGQWHEVCCMGGIDSKTLKPL